MVLVHGGGKRITEWLERLGVPSRFEGGLRVTDAASLEVAAAVLRGVVNSELVAGLRDLGRRCRRAVRGRWRPARSPSASRSSGLVARVVGLRRDLLDAILVGGQVPVVAPLARDADGIVCNVNADDVAAGIAAGLGARQLVLLTDVDGVRDADGRRLDTLTVAEADHLIETGVIGGGMVPKIRAALGALGLGRRRGDHRRLVRTRTRSRARSTTRRSGPASPRSGRPASAPPEPARIGEDRRRHMTGQELKRLRQRAIRELVVSRPVSSQRELVDALTEQGFAVTQATVSRDIADLGLMKAPRADGHVYVVAARTSSPPRRSPRTSGSSGS